MRPLPVLLAVLTLVLVVPAALGHATYPTDDGRFLITVGNLGEPVYTYQKSGLDLIIRENTTDRAEVPGVDATLNATLVAPGGEELNLPLQVQHGAVGRYSFSTGYTLTQPGLYRLHLVGTINGSTVDGPYDMPHVIQSQSDIMFPDRGLPTLRELDERLDVLNERMAGAEQELMHGHDEASQSSPAAGLALALLAVSMIVLGVARRRGPSA